MEPRVSGSGGLVDQLPADQGGQSAKGVQQPFVRLGLLRGGGQERLQSITVSGQGIFLLNPWGEPVEHPRLEKALGGGQVSAHMTNAVQDAAVAVQQD